MSLHRTPPEVARETERLLALAAEARMRGASLSSTIAGESMLPTLAPGAAIEIDLAQRRYERGVVFAFVAGRGLTAHRVIGRGWGRRARNYWMTRGDATLVPDAPVRVDSILGRVRTATADPGPPRRSAAGRAAGWILAAVVRIALELDVRLAHAITRGIFLRISRRQPSLAP